MKRLRLTKELIALPVTDLRHVIHEINAMRLVNDQMSRYYYYRKNRSKNKQDGIYR